MSSRSWVAMIAEPSSIAVATTNASTAVLRPPIAQERVTQGPEVLVRITLKKRFSDGTIAVDLDPLSRTHQTRGASPESPNVQRAEPASPSIPGERSVERDRRRRDEDIEHMGRDFDQV